MKLSLHRDALLCVLIVTFSISITHSRLAQATTPPPSSSYHFTYQDPKLSEQQLSEIRSILDGVSNMLGVLQRPRNVPVIVKTVQSQFSYNPSALKIGYSYKKHSRTAEFSSVQYAIAHEWGHAVFYRNMKDMSEHWKGFVNALNHWQESADPLRSGLNFRQHFLYRYNKPYNEFFADLVATLYFEDLEAMSKSLHFKIKGKQRSLDPRKDRSFTCSKNAPARLSNSDRRKHTSYSLFASVRCHLGQTYLNSENITTKKSELLHGTLQAIRSEFEYLAQADKIKIQPSALLADRFIAALDRELASLKGASNKL